MLMQVCNNWEGLFGEDGLGRLREFRYLTDRERAVWLMKQLEPYLCLDPGELLPGLFVSSESPETQDTEEDGH